MEILNNTALVCVVLALSFITLPEGIGKDYELQMLHDPSISKILVPPTQGVACIFCVVSAQLSALEAARCLALIHKGAALGLLKRASPCLYGQIGLV